MSTSPSEPDPALRRFFLDGSPEGGPPTLTAPDREHLCRVLRATPGDRILGLDGRGRAWELEVLAADRRRLELGARGEPIEEPPPGAPGAPLPWIELHCPLPRGGRAEELLDRLTQLGLARLVPLLTARTPPHARTPSPGRRARLLRSAREAIKQCGRLWLPEVGDAEELEALQGEIPGTRLLLDPEAPRALAEVLRDAERGWTRERPLILIAGPEGGLTGEEREALRASGAIPVRIGPHLLRIETAAEAAVAIAGNILGGE